MLWSWLSYMYHKSEKISEMNTTLTNFDDYISLG